MTFINNGNTNVTSISLINTNLPNGFRETMPSLDGNLMPGLQAIGVLTLTVPSNVQAGDYSWNGAFLVN